MFDIPDRARILYYGSDTRDVEAEPVTPDEYHLLPKLRNYMMTVMRVRNGIGLAAPQVGIFRQYFVMRMDDGGFSDCVNPEVIQMYGHEREGFEACLSIPPVGNGCRVARLENVRMECGTADKPQERAIHKLSGMDAIVAQHELDHLSGTFFINRVHENKCADVLRMFKEWRRQCKEPLRNTLP